MTQLADKLQPWIAAVEERPQGGPRWLQELRDRGAARFSALGFPTTRDEEWRFTSVAAIASTEFRLAAQGRPTAAELEGFVYTDAATRLVIVDGHFSPELSRTSGLPAGRVSGRWHRRSSRKGTLSHDSWDSSPSSDREGFPR